jgi:two-component system, NtrC family, sensor histidine kinase GlrK
MGSFRQLLLIAFLLIAALLGGTALRAVVILERLMAQSAQEAARALELNGAAQSLAARTAVMERAARQSLVLNDAVLGKRYAEESRAARTTLQEMTANGLAPGEAAQWQARIDAITGMLEGPAATALERERAVASEFRELEAINNNIIGQIQALITESNRALGSRLDASRARLTQQVVITVALAVVLGFCL